MDLGDNASELSWEKLVKSKDVNKSFPYVADITETTCTMFELRKEDGTYKLYYVSPLNFEGLEVRVSFETLICYSIELISRIISCVR